MQTIILTCVSDRQGYKWKKCRELKSPQYSETKRKGKKNKTLRRFNWLTYLLLLWSIFSTFHLDCSFSKMISDTMFLHCNVHTYVSAFQFSFHPTTCFHRANSFASTKVSLADLSCNYCGQSSASSIWIVRSQKWLFPHCKLHTYFSAF